jgi:hypothetical protein
MLNAQWNTISADMISEDEIDNLFNQLDQLEPPSYLISRILTSVSLLPRPLSVLAPGLWSELDGLVVRNDRKNLC